MTAEQHHPDCQDDGCWGPARTCPKPEPACNGICIMGNDIMEGGGHYGIVAYPHPDCERHG